MMLQLFVFLSAALASCSALQYPASTISAAPALLPDSISPEPAPAPDYTPLFPSPSGSELSPSEHTIPFIPSNPSPPNPDAANAPFTPDAVTVPTMTSTDSSSAAGLLHGAGAATVLAVGLLVFWCF